MDYSLMVCMLCVEYVTRMMMIWTTEDQKLKSKIENVALLMYETRCSLHTCAAPVLITVSIEDEETSGHEP